ncbi:MAG: hypothetical protein CMH56_15670 [Myxococcales bacterium]|nr:hypothetical protein [Myxococcales bacterium]|tara:strand:- start:375 stop:2174 length:1800 start_codon:yes stop_codon:yes gene_type:complete
MWVLVSSKSPVIRGEKVRQKVGLIRTLTDEVINNLAAGEVVERPASVLKELVENSLDAGATEIEVAIFAGGTQSIRVSDNGKGMSPEDAVHCFGRHATSKIQGVEDLTHLRSLGFRGEALAAIAAVSEINLKTREAEKDVGTEVDLSGGDIQSVAEAGVPVGTRLEVKNLFFNTPARKKFLKKEQTEAKWLEVSLKALALAAPHANFRFVQDGKPKWQMTADPDWLSNESGPDPERVAACLGTQVRSHLLSFSGQTEALNVSGFLVSPEVTRRDTQGIRLMVNGRWVSDRVLSQTIKTAYGPYLEPGRYPMCVLHLRLPDEHVDYNVHPQKSEVRISNRREVQAHLIRLITVFLVTKKPQVLLGTKNHPVNYALKGTPHTSAETQSGLSARDWFPGVSAEPSEPVFPPITPVTDPLQSSASDEVFHNRFTFVKTESDLWVLDVNSFLRHEVKDKIAAQIRSGAVGKQRLLFPLQFDAPALGGHSFESIEKVLEVFGFEISNFDGEKWMLKSLPSLLAEDNARDVFESALGVVLENVLFGKEAMTEKYLERVAEIFEPYWERPQLQDIKRRALQLRHHPDSDGFIRPADVDFFKEIFGGR